MSIEIRSVSELKGKTAKEFIEKADKAFINRHTVDFSKQVAMTNRILKKAKL